jgi:hypothetical protein
MGSRRWVDLPDWPPPAQDQRWYLGAGGTLRTSGPDDSAPDRYRYDPADPTPAVGGASLDWRDSGPKDQRRRESRPDVLLYTSEILTGDLTVIGPLEAVIHLRSSLDHTDLFVRLCDVSPRGTSRNLSDGIVRLTPGAPPRDPDGSCRVHAALSPTAVTFRRGHRLRLQVSSGAHPLFVRHTGTDEPLADATTVRVAEQEVFHDTGHRSYLSLPVVDA